LNYLGFFCSQECVAAFAARREELHEALAKENLSDIPEDVTVQDFERFALRIAVQLLQRPELKGLLPAWATAPEILALRIKEVLVQQLPPKYLRIERNLGPLPPDYTYQFTSPLPRRLLLKAAENLGMVTLERAS
jgi:hypothetical protein